MAQYDLIAIIGTPEVPVCDFCNFPDVYAVHQCEPSTKRISIPGVGFVDCTDADGFWGACAICDSLIRAEKWEELFAHSFRMAAFVMPPEVPDSLIKDFIRTQHEIFRATRKKVM